MDLFNEFFNAPSEGRMLPWIVLLPLFGAIINGLFGKGASHRAISTVAVGTVATAFLLALYCFVRLLTAGEGEHEGHGATAISYDLYRWFSVEVEASAVPVRVRFVMDHLSGIMTLMVTGIASLIHLYSTEYMGEDPGYRRFMTYLNLFTASMLILVLASNLPLMFVGWEGVGLCSYLLIGFWWDNPAYAAAGRKAFVVNRIGDFGVLIGTFILLSCCHSFEFADINRTISVEGVRMMQMGGGPIGITVATGAALFLFLGCTGKSAQLPLYVWLPDAMAGPTPVSALIHAATMVTAGVYLCCRLSPVFVSSETAMATIAVVGALTALLGASIGVVQNQMKKILAYSTVSQLGFMFAAVGCGAFAAGIFHVFTHAFFKACLFLGAGSVMHAVHAHGDADIRYLGGMRKYMPRTYWTFGVACLAIAGFPLTSGFFSKDEILLGALEATQHLGPWLGWFVFGVLALSAFLTAFYMFRLFFLTFWGEFRGGHPPDAPGHDAHDDEAHAKHEPHESGDAVTIPLMVLATGALIVGFLGLPHWVPGLGEYSWWGHWLHGSVASWPAGAEAEGEHVMSWFGPVAMAVGTAVGLGGIGFAYAWYANKSEVLVANEGTVVRIAAGVGALAIGALLYPLGMRVVELAGMEGRALPVAIMGTAAVVLLAIVVFLLVVAARNDAAGVQRWAFDKWRVDELYHAILLAPFRWVAVVAANVDRIAVDGLLTWVPAQLARGSGWALSRVQNGVIYAYTVGFIVGAAGLVWWFTFPHSELESTISGVEVTWSADRGPGYEYRWDFDSDGEWDADWSAEPIATHGYSGDEDAFFGLVAIVEGGELINDQPIEIPIDEEAVSIPVDQRTDTWLRPDPEGAPPGDAQVPSIRLEGARALIAANDALLRAPGAEENAEEHTFLLNPGDTARVGTVNIRIAVRVRATVQVRNAFGNMTRARAERVVRIPRTELEQISRADLDAHGVGR